MKIKKLEESLTSAKVNTLLSTSKIYGTGANLEKFQSKRYNKTKNPDVKPQDRRPKKDDAAA